MEPDITEWSSSEHALGYLAIQDQIPRRSEGEATLLEVLSKNLGRFLDLGTGDGRLLALVLEARPTAQAVGTDMSPSMLDAARHRFASDERVAIIEHNLNDPLPALGYFDAVVSSFAIHHCPDERKQSLYLECYDTLARDGVFMNLEHVASPTERLHIDFLVALDMTLQDEDRSNRLLDVWTQLEWMREIGFEDVDCLWKWREFALLTGVKRQ